MMRWAVDVAGIDVEADLQREEVKTTLLAKVAPTTHHSDAWRAEAEEKKKKQTNAKEDELGEVWVLGLDELIDARESKIARAPELSSPFSQHASPSTTLSGDRASSLRLQQSVASLSGQDVESPKAREIRVFCSFLSTQNKRTAVNITMTQANIRGIDIVNAFLMQAVASDERQAQRFSTNARLYKLFIADEFTGEEEMAVQLDLKARDFNFYAVNPLPAAKLFLFPQRTELLPPASHDFCLIVNIRSSDPQVQPIQRQCMVPTDMLAGDLEATVTRRLPASAIVQGSLRIKFGPLELNINEYYNFGAGCGQPNCPIAERTLLSLLRFGVTEVVVNGRAVEVAPDAAVMADLTEEIVIDMDVDEAMSFQQFEVISITRYGARQQRVLCVDGEHLYTMRPNSDAVPKTTERPIKDIEEVRVLPSKPKYMEISYVKASHYEEDHFECTTTYNCALLDEKLRIVRRELRKRAAEESTAPQEQKNFMHRFVRGFKSRWLQGKEQ